MKRFHVHVHVRDLTASVRFYANLFGQAPTVVKSDYAKWMLDDPHINFAVSQREGAFGVDHLGLQVDSDEELQAIGDRLRAVDGIHAAEAGTTCCYARSDKYWARDPQDVRWENFRSFGASETYGDPARGDDAGTCCGPQASGGPGASCCGPAAAPAADSAP